jgi:hypothetical protein
MFINLNVDLTYITKFKAYYICMCMALGNVGYNMLLFDVLVFQLMLSSKWPIQWRLLTGSLIPPLAHWKRSGLYHRSRPVLRRTLLAIANSITIPATL